MHTQCVWIAFCPRSHQRAAAITVIQMPMHAQARGFGLWVEYAWRSAVGSQGKGEGNQRSQWKPCKIPSAAGLSYAAPEFVAVRNDLRSLRMHVHPSALRNHSSVNKSLKGLSLNIGAKLSCKLCIACFWLRSPYAIESLMAGLKIRWSWWSWTGSQDHLKGCPEAIKSFLLVLPWLLGNPSSYHYLEVFFSNPLEFFKVQFEDQGLENSSLRAPRNL